eukprot:5754170-Pleurochrysis_carterae.AAC.1
MVQQQAFTCHSPDLDTMATCAHREYRCGRVEAWPSKRGVCVAWPWVGSPQAGKPTGGEWLQCWIGSQAFKARQAAKAQRGATYAGL